MTKKELKEVEALKTMLALRIYPEIEPDILPPENLDEVRNGYWFNSYSRNVNKACTSYRCHSYFEWSCANSQGPIKLYSTEKLAWQAMLHDLSLEFADVLRSVQKKAEELDD